MTKRETAINTATKSTVLNSKDTRKRFSKEEAKVILKSYILNKSKANGLDLSNTMFVSYFNWTNETSLEHLKKIACRLENILKTIEYIRNVEEKFESFSMKYNVSLKNFGRELEFKINADSVSVYADFDYFGIKKDKEDKDIYELKNALEYMLDDISNEIDDRESVVYLPKSFWKYADA